MNVGKEQRQNVDSIEMKLIMVVFSLSSHADDDDDEETHDVVKRTKEQLIY